MDAYERALRALVKPGDVVLDLGAGTGVMGMLAARRGAARVHAVESMAVAQLAKTLVAHNNLSDVVTVHHADALELAPVEPVDLVVSEFMGRFVVDDAMLLAVAASRAWMKGSARFCPSKVTLRLAPAGHVTFGPVAFFRDPVYGLDFSPAVEVARNDCYHTQLRADAIIGPPVDYAVLEPPDVDGVRFDREMILPITQKAPLVGLCGWFEAELAPNITLSTEPGRDTHWGQVLFPLPNVDVEPGDELRVRLWFDGNAERELWHWEGALSRAGSSVVGLSGHGRQRWR